MGTADGTPSAAVARAMLARLEAGTSVPAFSGGSSSAVLGIEGQMLSLSLCVIPRAVSRHNCLTRPDTITKLIKSALSHAKTTPSPDAEGRGAKRAKVVPTATIVVLLPASPDHDVASQCVSVAAAIARAAPTYTRKSGPGRSASVTICFAVGGKAVGTVAETGRVQAIVDGVRAAGELVDAPCNELTTTEFAKRAEAAAGSTPGVTFEMLTGDELKEAGLGGLYGVGQAAVEPPRLVILRYKGPDPSPESVCWVGKGIVYDTGGLVGALDVPARPLVILVLYISPYGIRES
jgi:probable aminopeptidase NPEPL1